MTSIDITMKKKMAYMDKKPGSDFAIQWCYYNYCILQERDSYKYKLWRLVESTPFEYFIMTLIVLNTILLMLKVRIIVSNKI